MRISSNFGYLVVLVVLFPHPNKPNIKPIIVVFNKCVNSFIIFADFVEHFSLSNVGSTLKIVFLFCRQPTFLAPEICYYNTAPNSQQDFFVKVCAYFDVKPSLLGGSGSPPTFGLLKSKILSTFVWGKKIRNFSWFTSTSKSICR